MSRAGASGQASDVVASSHTALVKDCEADGSCDIVAATLVPTQTGAVSFGSWLKLQSEDVRSETTASYFSFMEVQEKWRHAQQLPLKLITDTTTHKKHASSRVRYRQAIGSAFLQWKSGSGKDSKQQLADYLLTIRRYSGMPPKKDRVWLARCENESRHAEACEAYTGSACMPVKTGRRRRSNARSVSVAPPNESRPTV